MKSSGSRKERISARVRDYLSYIGIALAIGVATVFMAIFGMREDAFIRWGELLLFTVPLFGYFIALHRREFQRPMFWFLTAVFLSAHLTIFAIILTHIAHWRLIWFLPMYLEAPVFDHLTKRLR